MDVIKERIKNTKDIIVQKRREVFNLKEKDKDTNKKVMSKVKNFLFTLSTKTKTEKDISTLEMEIKNLNDLLKFLNLELINKRIFDRNEEFTKSLKGKLYIFGGILLTFYSILRIVLAFLSLFQNSNDVEGKESGFDILKYINSFFEYDIYQILSFLLNATIVILNVKSFFYYLLKMKLPISANIFSVLFALIMGIYNYSVVQLLGTGKGIYHQYFNLVYVISAIITIIILGILIKLKSNE